MDVERRSLLKGLAAGLTGAIVDAAPSEARDPAPDSGQGGTTPAATTTAPVAPAVLLDAHQRATLASLADLILPGAVAAGAAARVDRVAAVDTPVAQRRLLNAIARFDLEARAAAGVRWIDLAQAEQIAVLRRAAEGDPGQRPQPAWTRGQPVPLPTLPPPPTTLRDHLDVLKIAIGSAFATTEAGMRALGWSGQSSWRELPGCAHADPAHEEKP